MQVIDYDHVITSKGQWLALDIHLGINVDVGPCSVSIGFLASDLDIYSLFRNLSYNDVSFRKFYPEKSYMQGAYMTLSYCF